VSTFPGKEPWASDALMIIPVESTQVLMPESAGVLGVHAFLKMTHLPYTVKEMPNATYVSPNGNRAHFKLFATKPFFLGIS
jgi:hypothetical protein